jgi:hypothetical protein
MDGSGKVVRHKGFAWPVTPGSRARGFTVPPESRIVTLFGSLTDRTFERSNGG